MKLNPRVIQNIIGTLEDQITNWNLTALTREFDRILNVINKKKEKDNTQINLDHFYLAKRNDFKKRKR
jgi:hypothetical protein